MRDEIIDAAIWWWKVKVGWDKAEDEETLLNHPDIETSALALVVTSYLKMECGFKRAAS